MTFMACLLSRPSARHEILHRRQGLGPLLNVRQVSATLDRGEFCPRNKRLEGRPISRRKIRSVSPHISNVGTLIRCSQRPRRGVIEARIPAEARGGDALADRDFLIFFGIRLLGGSSAQRRVGIGHARLLIGIDEEISAFCWPFT